MNFNRTTYVIDNSICLWEWENKVPLFDVVEAWNPSFNDVASVQLVIFRVFGMFGLQVRFLSIWSVDPRFFPKSRTWEKCLWLPTEVPSIKCNRACELYQWNDSKVDNQGNKECDWNQCPSPVLCFSKNENTSKVQVLCKLCHETY